jgi:hypothetical protein
MKTIVFSDVIQCSLAECYQCFEEDPAASTFSVEELAGSSEMLLAPHSEKILKINIHHRDNLISHAAPLHLVMGTVPVSEWLYFRKFPKY